MGLESLTDTDESLEAQVAVNTDNITRLFAEQERLRDKLHVFESDRATVLLLAQKVDNLALQLPAMVERAAHRQASDSPRAGLLLKRAGLLVNQSMPHGESAS